MSNWSFLVSHAGNPGMLDACLTSIERFYPDERILVSLREEPYAEAAKYVAEHWHRATTFLVPGNGDDTDAVIRHLMICTPSQYAVHMEADCLLLAPLDDLRESVEAGAFVGVEDYILWPEDRPGFRLGKYFFRQSPHYHTASFFMVDVNRFFQEFGNNAIKYSGPSVGHNTEPYYGISKHILGAGWPIQELHVRETDPKFGFSMLYGHHVLHTWFGAWRLRNNVETASGVPLSYLRAAEANVLAEFWSRGDSDASLSDGFPAGQYLSRRGEREGSSRSRLF